MPAFNISSIVNGGEKGKNLHHAFLVTGYAGLGVTDKVVLDFIKENFNMEKGHPDLFIFSTKDFGIDQVDMMISANIRKPAMGHKKFIIASFNTISHQAQNSLLKTLEEPRSDTHIFLVTPSASSLLSTVLSRVQVVDIGGDSISVGGDLNTSKTKTSAEKFLTSQIPVRLEIIKKMLADKEDEKIDDSDINNFVRELELRAYDLENQTKNSKDSSKNTQEKGTTSRGYKNLKPFLKVDEYIRDASSSKKLLLEYLALRLPVY